MYIKADKLNRICAIVHKKGESETPQEFKEALNMFRGQQIQTALRPCLEYTKLTVLRANGNAEAAQRIDELHYAWNHKYE